MLCPKRHRKIHFFVFKRKAESKSMKTDSGKESSKPFPLCAGIVWMPVKIDLLGIKGNEYI